MGDEITIRKLVTAEEAAEAVDLQDLIWPDDETGLIPARTFLEVGQNGGLLLGAFLGERLVGFVLGLLGVDEKSPGRMAMTRLKHASHIMGVHPDYRDQGVGRRLKMAQREAVVGQGIRLVTWTYDPLLSNNAQVNIHRLGAVCSTYRRDYYGTMEDKLNRGIPTDRFQVDWWVTSPRVASRLEKAAAPITRRELQEHGPVLNPASFDGQGLPHPPDQALELELESALVEIPVAFQAMKRSDMALARAWRLHTRQVFEGAFAAGYTITDFFYLPEEPNPCSYYLLWRGFDVEG